jgi:hypothetical protein
MVNGFEGAGNTSMGRVKRGRKLLFANWQQFRFQKNYVLATRAQIDTFSFYFRYSIQAI